MISDARTGRGGELIDLCCKRRKRAAKALLLQHIVGVEEDLVEQLSF